MDDKQDIDTPPLPNGTLGGDVRDEISPPRIPEMKTDTPPPSRSNSNVSLTLQHLTDKALHFLSHSSNETLGACLVGLSASTYFVFGRVGLLLMGVAGGVVMHATWEGVRNDTRPEETKLAERERRREAGIEVVRRILQDRSVSSSSISLPETSVVDGKVYANHSSDLTFSSFPPQTEKALNHLTDSIINDYVYWWYAPQLPKEETFPTGCRRTLIAFILSLSAHLQRKRPADVFLDFLTNASSIIIVFLNELAAATTASPPSTSPEQAITTYINLKPDSSLAYILNEEEQTAKLREKAEDILQAYLDPKAYNCQPVQVFLKEVLAQLVLGMTVSMCARPEWINEWIVYLLEESETTKEVMEIVDAGMEGRDDAVKKGDVEKVVSQRVESEHKRTISAAEEAMDEAMREAKRLTQMMIEEDERRSREEQGRDTVNQIGGSSSENVSEDAGTTQGVPTPTSSQSDRGRTDEEEDQSRMSWSSTQATSIGGETPTTNGDHHQQFTSFDQMVPPTAPSPQSETPTSLLPSFLQPTTPLTLLNASITILDDFSPNSTSKPKQKPITDYLIQIEPHASSHPGWMIARKYADFETLHEVLRRISVITGVTGFVEKHTALPSWRNFSRNQLREELERYIGDAVRERPLAECEGMKRFLERDGALGGGGVLGGGGKGGQVGVGAGVNAAGAAFGKLGGDVMNVLSKAPKQGSKVMLGGGKAVLGGVAGFAAGTVGAVGAVTGAATGVKKVAPAGGALSRTSTGSVSTTVLDGGAHRSQSSVATVDGYSGANGAARQSHDSLATATTPPKPKLGRHISTGSVASVNASKSSLDLSRHDASTPNGITSSSRESLDSAAAMNLPPPPSSMPEHYTFASDNLLTIPASASDEAATTPTTSPSAPKPPLTDPETIVAIELLFALITELYTLSSAWNFRRTLLSAAKTFLLRPGNPQLLAIRTLLQTSLIESNLTDEGIAGHLYKLRENALPTAEELKIWERDYPEKTPEEKEKLRLKARDLLVRYGVPAALQSVMGAAATGEAMGRVHDCLMVGGVSRGLVFGLLVQAVRVVTD